MNVKLLAGKRLGECTFGELRELGNLYDEFCRIELARQSNPWGIVTGEIRMHNAKALRECSSAELKGYHVLRGELVRIARAMKRAMSQVAERRAKVA